MTVSSYVYEEHLLVFSHFFHVHSHDLGADLLLSRFIRKVLNLLVSLCRSNFEFFFLHCCCCHFQATSIDFMWNLQNSNLKIEKKSKIEKKIVKVYILLAILHFDVLSHSVFIISLWSFFLLVLMTKMFIESFNRH